MQKSKPHFKIQKLVLAAIGYLLLVPTLSSAATLYFEPASQEVNVGEQFEVRVFLDTENEEINAVEGKVIFPENLLELKEIRDGATIINFWIERPKIKSDNQINFSGIIPGGYIAKKGLIFSAIFQSKNEGGDTIEIHQAKTLLNDGKGTEASITISNLQFLISKEVPLSQIPPTKITDTDPPEPFEPIISQEPEIFDGKYFLVFLTQDKGSGIDHYEILEKEQKSSIRGLIKKDEWQVDESPYLLKDQKLKSHIFVKAIDKVGNERIATLSPQNPLKWYENYFVWLAIFITIIIAYIIWRCVKKFGFSKLSLLGIVLAIASLTLPISVFAASLYLSPATGSYNVGQTFSVVVYVSSSDQAMNAASGVISFPQDKLEVASLSKSGSIFSLWVQEPSFSNSAGIINFEGIVLNPGFTGATGKIITTSFKVKAAGIANLNFSSGSVLANDGKGTNILTSLGNATFGLGGTAPPTVSEPIIPGTPKAPKVSSLTHSDLEKWYSNNDPKFSWEVPEDVTGIRLLVDHKPIAVPTVFYSEPISEKQLEDLADGIWYFHVQLRNKSGWGGVSHYKFQIDTIPPLPFKIEVKEGEETTSPHPTLFFETSDEMSGVDYYEVKTDQESPVQIKEKEYKIPVQSLGRHTIIAKAVDKAGNYTLAMTEINILPIETPVITDYPQTLLPGVTLSIKGTAVPEATVKVYIQKDEKEAKTEETKSDKEGKWSYIKTEPLDAGVYKIWVEAIDSLGARSKSSEKVTIEVTPPAFIRIGKLAIDYLTTIITLLVLLLVIVLGIIWSWQRIKQRKKRLRKEITEAEKALYHAFKALKEETEEQVAKLDGKPDLSDREKKIYDELKKALKISEKFISKEIKDIEKEL